VLFLGFAAFAAGQSGLGKALPRIANPEVLAIEMAKALHLRLARDREGDVKKMNAAG
jgi:hypothetical protein